MKKRLMSKALLTAVVVGTVVFSAPTFAETYPTLLNTVKSNEVTYLTNPHTKYTLTTTQGKNTHSVKINNKTYYYTPVDGDTNVVTLANTGSVALKPTTVENEAVFDISGTLYTYDTTKLPISGYTLKKVDSATVNSIIIPQYDSSINEIVNKYYEISLDKATYGSGSSSKTLTVKLPTNKSVTITGNYDSAKNTRITSVTSGTSIKRDFMFIGSSSSAGSILNKQIVNEISGNFIGNYVNSTSGSAYTARGGAISNAHGTINNIVGNFIGNWVKGTNSYVQGGAIINEGSIGDITGNFIGNYIISSSTDSALGGAIENNSATKIGNITGDFIGNYVSNTKGGAYGGAIRNNNYGPIGNITGDFISNYVYSENSKAKGGALYSCGIVGDISGNFFNNYVVSDKGMAFGGAIYNYDIGKIGIITGNFTGNYTKGVTAQGGAIWTDNNLSFLADNVVNIFSGNYVTLDNIIKNYEAIYVNNNESKLTFTANNDGKFVFDDNINGAIGYDILLTGDSTGSFDMKNENSAIKNADVTLENITLNLADAAKNAFADTNTTLTANSGTINLVDNVITNYAINKLISNSAVKYAIDVNLSGTPSADKLITGTGSSGTVTISSINFTPDTPTSIFTAQILKAKDNNIQLALDSSLITPDYKIGRTSRTEQDTINVNTDFDTIYNTYSRGGDLYGNLALATTSTTNDSITINVDSSKTVWDETRTITGVLGDTLNLVNTLDTTETKNFNFKTTEDVYTATVSPGETKGILNINGVAGEVNKAVIDLNGNTGFTVKNGNTLNVENVEIKNATAYRSNGGAINNAGTVSLANTDFTGNYAFSDKGSAYAGAIYNNTGIIKNISGNFTNNYVNGYKDSYSGAIYNASEIGRIDSNFTGNYVISTSTESRSGAVCNYQGIIGNVTGNFTGNYASSASNVYGGAIYNYHGKIASLFANFNSNYINSENGSAQGGAIRNAYSAEINDITGNFIENYAQGKTDAKGGAIYNYNSKIANITGNFENNYVISSNNSGYGGAIFNNDTIGTISGDFIGNYVQGKSAKGGAIYTEKDLSFSADDKTNTFTDNYVTTDGNTKDYQAIYVASKNAKLTFTANNNGKFIFNDNMNGKTGYDVVLTGDMTGSFDMKNENSAIKNADVTLENITLNLADAAKNAFADTNTTLTANSGTINLVDNTISNYNFNQFTLTGNTNMTADVDLANSTMDTITAEKYGEHTGNLNIVGMNLISDSTTDTTVVPFAEAGLRENVINMVSSTGAETVNPFQTSAYSPLFKYGVGYNNSTGDFTFTKQGINPAIASGAVSAEVGALSTQNRTLNYAFVHSDYAMSLPTSTRWAYKMRNQYSLADTRLDAHGNPFSTNYGSVWVKPYVGFESVPLENGPTVNNTTYGTLIGYDSKFRIIKHDWDRSFTGYIGYNGATQSYDNVTTYQNGGVLGGTMSLYKGNFFNALTLSVGAAVGSSNTQYGTDNITSLVAGVGDKFGYNFEFKGGRYIIQPSMLVAYTFINTFDYRNSAGVDISATPLHNIQLAPTLKFMMNTQNGWQPYASVGMVWNLLNTSRVTANDLRLPTMSIKPYVTYGIGIQKQFKDNFSAFGQAMIQNGGRNGIVLTAGCKWMIGRATIQKVHVKDNKTSYNSQRHLIK